MENEPIARPWYRLASLARLESLARATNPTPVPTAPPPAPAPAQTPAPAPAAQTIAPAPIPTPTPTSATAAPAAQTASSGPIPTATPISVTTASAPIPTPTPASMTATPITQTAAPAPDSTATTVTAIPDVQAVAPIPLPTPAYVNDVPAFQTTTPTPTSTIPAEVGTPLQATQTPAPKLPLSRTPTEQLQAQPQPLTPPRPDNGASLKSPPPQPPIFSVQSQNTTPPESPNVIKPTSSTPPESPKIRQLSPIKAPPSLYPEPEPKPLQSPPQNSNGSLKTISDINENLPPPSLPPVNGQRARSSSPKRVTEHHARNGRQESGEMKVITMAGENTGAYMELRSHHGHHDNKKHQQQGYHLPQNQNKESKSQNEEGNSDDKKKDKGNNTSKPVIAMVNSNVQSINNSILFGTSCSQKSPGVHTAIVSKRRGKHKGTTQ